MTMSFSLPLVKMQGLHKSYGPIQVLKGIDIEMKPGERVVVIGPSGGGKSTLLRVMMGLEKIDSGSISFDGKPYISSAAIDSKTMIDTNVRRSIGMVFQHYTLFPHLNVLQNLVLAPCKVRGEPRSKAEGRAQALLERFGLAAKAKAYPAQLSGGQKQRVAIARALAMRPSVMLFDEATSALDPELVGEVLNVIRSLAFDGMTMILVTHEIAFAREVADQVIFMRDGVVVEAGPPSQVIDNPQQAATQSFLTRFNG